MGLKKSLLWFSSGLLIIIAQSFFLTVWPFYFWLLVFNWRQNRVSGLILILGFINDLFLLEPLGKTSLIGLGLFLLTQVLKKVLALSGPVISR